MTAENETRRIGVDVIGNAPWGTHLCQFYDGKQDLIDILVPYFRQGLADNEFCMWVTSEPLGVEEAKAALRAVEPDLDKYLHEGRIEILDYSEWYTRAGRFDADSVLKGWVEKLENALARGYEGLRLTGNTFWLEQKDWADFTAYEEAINRVIGNYNMLAVCTYALEKCGAPEIMDVVSNHRYALVKRNGRWQMIESSERKGAEEKLRRKQAEIQALFDNTPAGLVLFDGKKPYKVLAHNRCYQEWFAEPFRSKGMVGLSLLEYAPEVEASGCIAAIEEALATKKPKILLDFPYAPNPPEIQWFNWHMIPIIIDGETVALVSMSMDVSERHGSKEALDRMRNMLEQAQGIAHLGSFEYVAATRATVWSEEEYRIYGLDPSGPSPAYDEMLTKCIHPDDAARLHETFTKAMENRSIYELEHRIVRPDGAVRWVYNRAHPYFDDKGKLMRYVGATLDITGRKAAGERLRIVADFTYDWEYWRGTDKRFIYVSPACERITGYSSDAFMKDPEIFLRIIHEDDRDRVAEHIVAMEENREPAFLQFRLRDRKDDERWIEHVCQPVFGSQGEYLGRRASNRDVTDRKSLERRIEYLSRFPSEDPNPVLRIAADGTVKYANDAAAPVLSAWKSGVEKKAPRAWRKRVAEAIKTGAPTTHEAAVGKDTYSFCVAPVAEQGYANLYGNRTTELKEMHKQEKLAAAARTALDTVEAMREGVALIGMDGTVRSVNPALAKLTGYGSDQLVGRNLKDLISQLLVEEDAETARGALQIALFGQTPALGEMTLVSAQGLRMPILPKVAFIKDDSGSPVTIILTIQDISDIVSANKAVRENEQRLEEAQRIAHIGNWDWNILDNTLAWSDEIFRVFGLEPQEFGATYEAFLNSVHPDDRQFVQESVDKALYENQPYSIDHRIVLPNGLERVVHEQAEVYRNESGRPIRMLGTVQDITVRKRAEDRNRITAALLLLFPDKRVRNEYLDAVNEVVRNWCGCRCSGIRVVDEKRRIPYVSSLGFNPDFLAAECWLSLDDNPCTCTRVISGNPAPHDKSCMTSAGSFFCNDTGSFFGNLSRDQKSIVRGVCMDKGFRSIAVIPIRHQGKTLAALHLADEASGRLPLEKVTFIDSIAPLIGEAIHRFHVEEDLLSSERRYRALVENLPAITYTASIDAASTNTYVSPQIERILGFSPADYKADPDIWRKQLHPDDRDRVIEELALAHSNGESFVLEYRMLARDGRIVWLRDRGAIVRDETGEPSYAQGVMYDITEEKKAESAVRSLASHLALAEEQERKHLAVALHDTINQTLALSKIKLGALNRLLDDDRARNALQEVRDLFSQAVEQTRSLSFELSPPILYELGLRAAVDWLGDKCGEQYGFEFLLSGKSDAEDFDEHIKVLMFQSIRELLTNAGKHADAKRVHVTLDRRDGELTAIVEDDGKGFDFESARKRVGQRDSIGLFSIEDRMQHLGGKFKVESETGKGTRIALRVPLGENGERGARNSERGTRNGELGTGNSERGTRNSERGTRNAELGTRNGELGTGSAERGTRNSERGTRKKGRAMGKEDLSSRTKAFALRVIKLADALPDSPVGRVIKGQLIRSGTSTGANYRAAKRAKSPADFINKMGTVEEEADESMYWMELIVEAGLMNERLIADLYSEADEILAMVVSSIKTAKKKGSSAESVGEKR